MVKLIKASDNEEYYERLNIGITMSNMWNSLQSKSEIDFDKSENGYQQIAKTMAGNIARGLNLNVDLAECLTMCNGSFFPSYGSVGKKIIMQFIQDKKINISEADLARNYIEYDLYSSGIQITPEFDQYLQELFDASEEPKTAEVKLARLCAKILEGIKRIEIYSKIEQVELLYELIKDAENSCISSKNLVESKKFQEMLRGVPEYNLGISKEKKEKIYKDLIVFIESSGEDKINGIYEYIGASERR